MTLKDLSFFDLPTPTGAMRVHRFLPKEGELPAVILYSEIYQMTGPIARLAARLACEGFEVLVPEVYHEYEAPSTVLAYDKEGTDRGNFLKFEKPIAAFDSDAKTLIDSIMARPDYRWKGVGAIGFCLGGHLAFRAALDLRVKASSCWYPTDIHSATLGKGQCDDTLARSGEIASELLLIWGRQDPHVPTEGRRKIYDALTAKERTFQWHEFNAAHAFARDEGVRYDEAATRIGFEMTLELFKRKLIS
ncbi:MAG: dienelactone hydrolase family protein [Proteobacteria bacterium]|nr:dienelactone hydrolase family protein [Pseudomonadota bacterium]